MARWAPLSRGHPPEEQDIGPVLVAAAVAHREVGGVDAVVDDPGDGDVRGGPPLGVGDGHDGHPVGVGPVDVGELLVERSVDGGGHRQTGVVLGVERAHHRVVVDHVAVADRLVGVDDVPDLGDRPCRSGCPRPRAGPTCGGPGRSNHRWRRGGRRGRHPGARGPAGRPPTRSRRRAGGGWVSKVGRSFRSAWRDSSIPTGRVGSPDATAAWPSGLGRGLQSPVRRFDSARRLQSSSAGATPAGWGLDRHALVASAAPPAVEGPSAG